MYDSMFYHLFIELLSIIPFVLKSSSLKTCVTLLLHNIDYLNDLQLFQEIQLHVYKVRVQGWAS
jgi:hypothetical protein